MFKSLIAIALLAAGAAPMGAQACAGCGVKFNGVSSNGLQLNGVQFNDWRLNGIQLNGVQLNGFRVNGILLNGIQLNDFRLNGILLNGIQINGVGTSAWRFDRNTTPRAAQAPASVDWSSLALDRIQVRLPQ